MRFYRSAALWVALFANKGDNTIAEQLIAYYGLSAFLELHDVLAGGQLSSRVSGVADATLLGSSTVELIDGRYRVNGYYDEGITTYDPNGTTIIMPFISDAQSVLGGSGYAHRINYDINYEIYLAYPSANVLSCYSEINGVSKNIVATNLIIPDKEYIVHYVIDTSSLLLKAIINGLLHGQAAMAVGFSGSSISDANSAVGERLDAGFAPHYGYLDTRAIVNSVVTEWQARRDFLKIIADVNPYGHHVKYGGTTNGVDESFTVSANAAINQVFATGGSVIIQGILNAASANDVLLDKGWATNGWEVYVSAVSGDGVKLEFDHKFSTDGTWVMSDFDLTLNEPFSLTVAYDGSDVANNPTFTIDQNNTVTVLTVGSGLTESQTPIGTISDDSGDDLTFSSTNIGGSYASMTWIQCALIKNDALPTVYYGDDLNSLSPNGYWKFGDYILNDGSTLDNITTGGTATIYDASGNGNNASGTNLTNLNLEQAKPDPTSYNTAVHTLLNPDVHLIGYGANFYDLESAAVVSGTATANDGWDYLGNSQIAFTTNTCLDVSSLISGSIPSTFSLRMRFSINNFADNADNYMFRFYIDGSNEISINKTTGNELRIRHEAAGNIVTDTYDVSGEHGIHELIMNVVNETCNIYWDGDTTPVLTVTNTGACSGTLVFVVVGSYSTTPTLELNGDVIEFEYLDGATMPIASPHQLLNRG